MAQVNRYFVLRRFPRPNLGSVCAVFALDLSATQAARMAGVSVRSVNPIFLRLRRRLAQECELHSPFKGNLEADESYFGPRRVRGKRGARSRFKDHRLGLLKPRRQSYTEIAPMSQNPRYERRFAAMPTWSP